MDGPQPAPQVTRPRTYAATRDLLLVSKLLGHASVETTQRYIAMPDDRLRAAVEATRLAA